LQVRAVPKTTGGGQSDLLAELLEEALAVSEDLELLEADESAFDDDEEDSLFEDDEESLFLLSCSFCSRARFFVP
jgi:hypothetical protein